MQVIEFTITREDFIGAQRLHQVVCLTRRWYLVRVALVAGGLGLLFAVLAPSGDSRIVWGLVVATIYIASMAFLVVLGRLVFLPINSRKQFSQRKDLGLPLSYTVEPSFISVTTKNGFSKMPTADFLKWSENSKSVLLYRSDNMFNFIPKRAIDDAFHAALIDELARARVPKAGF